MDYSEDKALMALYMAMSKQQVGGWGCYFWRGSGGAAAAACCAIGESVSCVAKPATAHITCCSRWQARELIVMSLPVHINRVERHAHSIRNCPHMHYPQARELIVMSLPVHDDVMMRMLEALVQVGATAKQRRQLVSGSRGRGGRRVVQSNCRLWSQWLTPLQRIWLHLDHTLQSSTASRHSASLRRSLIQHLHATYHSCCVHCRFFAGGEAQRGAQDC